MHLSIHVLPDSVIPYLMLGMPFTRPARTRHLAITFGGRLKTIPRYLAARFLNLLCKKRNPIPAAAADPARPYMAKDGKLSLDGWAGGG